MKEVEARINYRGAAVLCHASGTWSEWRRSRRRNDGAVVVTRVIGNGTGQTRNAPQHQQQRRAVVAKEK